MLVRVKEGRRHNGRNEKGVHTVYEAGATLEVTSTQFEAFKDKLEPVNKEEPKKLVKEEDDKNFKGKGEKK